MTDDRRISGGYGGIGALVLGTFALNVFHIGQNAGYRISDIDDGFGDVVFGIGVGVFRTNGCFCIGGGSVGGVGGFVGTAGG